MNRRVHDLKLVLLLCSIEVLSHAESNTKKLREQKPITNPILYNGRQEFNLTTRTCQQGSYHHLAVIYGVSNRKPREDCTHCLKMNVPAQEF